MGESDRKTPPNFTQHEVAVPFGCSPEQIQGALLEFLVKLVTAEDMRDVTQIFFVPVGLPGMGKSTLAKNIRMTIQKSLSVESKAASSATSSIAPNFKLNSPTSEKYSAEPEQIDQKLSESTKF